MAVSKLEWRGIGRRARATHLMTISNAGGSFKLELECGKVVHWGGCLLDDSALPKCKKCWSVYAKRNPMAAKAQEN